jgi:hypothetical protein
VVGDATVGADVETFTAVELAAGEMVGEMVVGERVVRAAMVGETVGEPAVGVQV